MPDTPKQKSPAQIQVEALNRKRKPLISFESKDIEVVKKKHAEELAALNRQLVGMQAELTAKEAKIQELEDQIAKLQKPADTGPPVVLTEAAPGQPGTRQTRRAAAAAPKTDEKPKDEDKPKEPEQKEPGIREVIDENMPKITPAPAKPVRPGDGIEEDD